MPNSSVFFADHNALQMSFGTLAAIGDAARSEQGERLSHVVIAFGIHMLLVFAAFPLMLLIAVVELTSGVFRYSMTEWYRSFAKETSPDASAFFLNHWGLLLCLFGVVGGFAGGIISDKFFQSRRGPPARVETALVSAT